MLHSTCYMTLLWLSWIIFFDRFFLSENCVFFFRCSCGKTHFIVWCSIVCDMYGISTRRPIWQSKHSAAATLVLRGMAESTNITGKRLLTEISKLVKDRSNDWTPHQIFVATTENKRNVKTGNTCLNEN
jgi:hypothetical protein